MQVKLKIYKTKNNCSKFPKKVLSLIINITYTYNFIFPKIYFSNTIYHNETNLTLLQNPN